MGVFTCAMCLIEDGDGVSFSMLLTYLWLMSGLIRPTSAIQGREDARFRGRRTSSAFDAATLLCLQRATRRLGGDSDDAETLKMGERSIQIGKKRATRLVLQAACRHRRHSSNKTSHVDAAVQVRRANDNSYQHGDVGKDVIEGGHWPLARRC
ncbi:hypothetical protein BB8028_0007g04380 [Beauveria bassiana]|uniref:Uncharacterized protein n=1 Tax=Beauveria bassiana TaxID=176275 RepID=A0A2S7YMJ9_BEABA|nr:hypothetical protein BB8028_0007g04380 [Beauveria bassiana]